MLLLHLLSPQGWEQQLYSSDSCPAQGQQETQPRPIGSCTCSRSCLRRPSERACSQPGRSGRAARPLSWLHERRTRPAAQRSGRAVRGRGAEVSRELGRRRAMQEWRWRQAQGLGWRKHAVSVGSGLLPHDICQLGLGSDRLRSLWRENAFKQGGSKRDSFSSFYLLIEHTA